MKEFSLRCGPVVSAKNLLSIAYFVYVYNIQVNWAGITGFDWDKGNARKNEKHGVTQAEIEQVFHNAPLIVASDTKHSQQENRYHALGRTDTDRRLHITFTLRSQTLIRPISARDMSVRERAIYEEALKTYS